MEIRKTSNEYQISKLLSQFVLGITMLLFTAFTPAVFAKQNITIEQCQPGPEDGTNGIDSNCIDNPNPNGWKTGKNSGPFAQGDSLPYRTTTTNAVSGDSYTLLIEFDTTKAGEHALAYLTSYDRTMMNSEVCTDYNPGPSTICDSFSTFPVPPDPQVVAGPDGVLGTPDDIAQVPGVITLYGGVITSVAYTPLTTVTGDGTPGNPFRWDQDGLTNDDGNDDNQREVQVTYTATVNGTGSSGPVLAWAAYIAKYQEWNDRAFPQGSPYHTRLNDWDCDAGDCSAGQQDVQLAEQAVVVPSSLTIIKDAFPDSEQGFNFSITSSGNVVNDLDGMPVTVPTLSDDGINPDPDPTPYFYTNDNLSSGTYLITELATDEWQLESVQCTEFVEGISQPYVVTPSIPAGLDEGSVSVSLDPGQRVTCTFRNIEDPNPAISLVKTAVKHYRDDLLVQNITPNNPITPIDGALPGDEAEYTFLVTNIGNVIVSDVKIDDPAVDNGGFLTCTPDTLEPPPPYSNLPPTNTLCTGRYTLDGTNDINVGSFMNSATAVGTEPGGAANAVVSNQDDETIYFAKGKIIIKKETAPDGDPQKFTFNSNYSSDFQLADGESNDSGELLAGMYSVAEADLAGWDLSSATCDDGSPVNAIDLQSGETVTCTFTNTKRGQIIVAKETLPDGSTQSFGFTGDVTASLTDGQSSTAVEVIPGTYSAVETALSGWDLTALVCSDDNSSGNVASRTASFNVEPGETVTCTFTNTQRGDFDLLKQANGVEATSAFNFTLNGPEVNESDSSTPVIDFGHPNPPGAYWLLPDVTYTVCETGIAAGTTSHWFSGVNELPFVGGLNDVTDLLQVYNPDDSGQIEPPDLGNRCVNFEVTPGESLSFVVDNRTPLGDARTPGYWKNWSSCSNGSQFSKATAEYFNDPTGLIDARHYTLDEILTESYPQLAPLHAYDTGVLIGELEIAGDTSGDVYDGESDAECEVAVRVLNSSDQVASKRNGYVNHSNDPAYKLGRYLLAYIANQTAGAYQCELAEDAAEAAQALLLAVGFDGTGNYLDSKSIRRNATKQALAAEALYYHGILGQYVENDPALSCGAGL